MNKARLSSKARRDLKEISIYGIEMFGQKTAETYLQGIRDLLVALAAQPEIGTASRSRHKNMRRHPYQRHVIFYVLEPTGIHVLRIYPMARLREADDLPS